MNREVGEERGRAADWGAQEGSPHPCSPLLQVCATGMLLISKSTISILYRQHLIFVILKILLLNNCSNRADLSEILCLFSACAILLILLEN